MKLDPETQRLVSASLVRMNARSPFFAALALFARFQASATIPTAATDGRDIFINPRFFHTLSGAEQDGLLAHEVLHAALMHVTRRQQRDPKLWNVAADIVINGMLARDGYMLPQGGLRDEKLEHLSAEEVYDLLQQKAEKIELPQGGADLIGERPADADDGEGERPGEHGAETLRKYWEQAQQQAQVGMEATVHGEVPKELRREFNQLARSHLDWRSYLWRYLVQTPTDFTGFDRRFVGRGLYLETLAGESLRVNVCVDTSGSINRRHLDAFIAELRAILQAYPHIHGNLYYADSRVHGPHPLTPHGPLPTPVGGGGTDFRPFFRAAAEAQEAWTPTLAVYLTDGNGPFPKERPDFPVLWVVTPGGRALEAFPFGEAVRLTLSG
jgi:predicted metal-dependent peptidase